MLKRTSLVFRLFVMGVLALGLGTIMASSTAAQGVTTGICQQIVGGEIDQDPVDCSVEEIEDGICEVIIDGAVFQNVQCNGGGCPQQFILENGDIFQFQCGDGPAPTATTAPATSTTVPATATTVPATATTVPATATDVPATATTAPGTATATTAPGTATATTAPGTATNVPATATEDDGGQANPPDDDDNGDNGDDGGQAEEPMEVNVLPDTGQGPASGQSNTATMLLLGAMGMVLTLGAVAMRLRKNG